VKAGTSTAVVTSPALATAPAAPRRVTRKFFEVSAAEFKTLAVPRLVEWRRTQRHALAMSRLEDRIAALLSDGVSLAEVPWGLEALGYSPATIAKYLAAAKRLVPEAKEDRELARLSRHFTSSANALRAARESKALTPAQVRLLVADLSTVVHWAIRITWLTASRICDWRKVRVIFHPQLIEVRYAAKWKSDQSMKRRIVKWLPRGGADSPAAWDAAIKTLVLNPKSVIAHIKTVAPDLGGHSLRHGAITFLEAHGHATDAIAALTNHAPCLRFSAMEEHYFAPWSPSTSVRSQKCLSMVAVLLNALESP
jgi:integrase